MAHSTRVTLRFLLASVLAVAFAGGIIYGPQFAGKVAYAVSFGQLQAQCRLIAASWPRWRPRTTHRLSPLFRKVAKVVMPAVVEVRVTKRGRDAANGPIHSDDRFFRHFFGDQTPRRQTQAAASRNAGPGQRGHRGRRQRITHHQ